MKKMKYMLPLCGLIILIGSCGRQHDSSNDISPAPLIRSVSTGYDGKAVIGKPVVVEGYNFGHNIASNEILLGVGLETERIRPTEVSEGRIVFVAPEINGTSIAMRVASGGKESSEFTLEYDRVRCDSVLLYRNAKVTKLREGVTWINIYDTWEGSIRSINLVEIELSETNRIAIACPLANTQTSVQCLEHGAFLGVNGSYFSHTYVKVDGQVIQPGKDQGVNAFMHDGVFTIDDNVPAIGYIGTNERASQLPNMNIMCCGPLLMTNDVPRIMVDHSHNTTTHPRTGVGITKEGRLLLVTVDGRFPEKAVGMSTTLFTRLFDALGAEHALNLDGGGSTTLWIEGYGIVNHPCDERNWDDPVERKIGSIIYLK